MKRLFWSLTLVVFCLPAVLLAQVFTGNHNESIEVSAIGPLIKNDGLYWTMSYTTRTNDIDLLTFTDISDGGSEQVLSLNKKQIYTEQTHFSRKLQPAQFHWMYEKGKTHRLFRVSIRIKGQDSNLYIPLTFTEGGKQTFRLMLKINTGYEQETSTVPLYHYLDGRKWIARNSGEDHNQRLVEYTLAEERITSWTELFTQSVIRRAIDPEDFIELIKNGLEKDCDSLTFTSRKIAEGKFFYEWKHNGCGGYPPQHEMAIVFALSEETANIRYTYKGYEMPEANYAVWKEILTR